MTDHNELHLIKTIAKRLARACRIPHHEALNHVANACGHPHWKGLTVAWKKSWRPSTEQMDGLEAMLLDANPAAQSVALPEVSPATDYPGEWEGSIDGHPYRISIDFEVLMQGRGWAICIEQAPSEDPQVEITDRRIKANPIQNPDFVSKALEIAQTAAEKLRSRIASDWPRRSTMPDAEGKARHPLFHGVSRDWCCLHCDGVFTGAQMAANMWHCPKCSATPIDIFEKPSATPAN